MATLGERIRAERSRNGWTQQEAGAKIGVDRLTLHRWENGVTAPGAALLRKRLENWLRREEL